ncbi:hypothetical protein [Streptomyces venezuelae]|uniref:hypothetical protein n=1 Tax=Streptomyces venezuelae TaxID=54571 RepID=UPI003653CDB6
MRLRYTIGSALGALALIVAIPTSAHAEATGIFYYKYGDPANPQESNLTSPATQTCIVIPEVDGKDIDAFDVDNKTDKRAWLFSDDDCFGNKTEVAAQGGTDKTTKFKSVYFPADG